jgi:RecJ-like exonuclease
MNVIQLPGMVVVQRPVETLAKGGKSCPACGGTGQMIGKLGSRTHYRCRQCGMDFSHAGKGETHRGYQPAKTEKSEGPVCPKCHGTGEMRGEKCPACGGTGQPRLPGYAATQKGMPQPQPGIVSDEVLKAHLANIIRITGERRAQVQTELRRRQGKS